MQFNMDAEIFWSIFSRYVVTTKNYLGGPDPACRGDQGPFLLSVGRGALLFERSVSRSGKAAANAFRMDPLQHRRHPLPGSDRPADLAVGEVDQAVDPS